MVLWTSGRVPDDSGHLCVLVTCVADHMRTLCVCPSQNAGTLNLTVVQRSTTSLGYSKASPTQPSCARRTNPSTLCKKTGAWRYKPCLMNSGVRKTWVTRLFMSPCFDRPKILILPQELQMLDRCFVEMWVMFVMRNWKFLKWTLHVTDPYMQIWFLTCSPIYLVDDNF